MADDLYTRYMKADAARRAHRGDCTQCAPDAPCTTGQRLHESFTRLQDAYLTQQKRKR
ncbi:hypothetical protein [Streptomyces sp. NPDC003006]